MRSILEAFTFCDFTPEPRSYWKRLEYKELSDLIAQTKEKLLAKLNEADQELLQAYTDSLSEQHSIECDGRFIHGFTMGLTLTAEAFVTARELAEDE